MSPFLKYELCTSLKWIEYNFSHIIEHLGLCYLLIEMM